MSIKILSIGKKHEDWVADGIDRYSKRLKKPFDLKWQLLPHSSRQHEAARAEESERLLAKIDARDHVILLDERGTMLTSPKLSKHLQDCFVQSKPVVLVIGGAYGVTEELRERANLQWSLSELVFPHQLVRLVLTEQLYRAQDIAAGGSYHHS
ncbi:23S rRNA (pseudouridine(1915)-N(3))-methyltransferase RlmH [Micrococcoides hystricis]|uniref:Ribosomal RNA large subunit methyltransferase H n=1 Tax=Micrococcoides hystricis TaxID=1572761 RepID=A0ABV6PAU4_9MICC